MKRPRSARRTTGMPATRAPVKPVTPHTRAGRTRPKIRTRAARASSWRLKAKSFLLGFLKIAFVAVLPFVLGVRAAVFFYLRGAATWVAMGLAAVIMLGIVSVYAAKLSHHFTGRARFVELMKWVAAPLVAAWCAYALLYLAGANAK